MSSIKILPDSIRIFFNSDAILSKYFILFGTTRHSASRNHALQVDRHYTLSPEAINAFPRCIVSILPFLAQRGGSLKVEVVTIVRFFIAYSKVKIRTVKKVFSMRIALKQDTSVFLSLTEDTKYKITNEVDTQALRIKKQDISKVLQQNFKKKLH